MSLINTHNVANHLARSAAPGSDAARPAGPVVGPAHRVHGPDRARRRIRLLGHHHPGAPGGRRMADRRREGLDRRMPRTPTCVVVYAQTAPGSGARGIAAFRRGRQPQRLSSVILGRTAPPPRVSMPAAFSCKAIAARAENFCTRRARPSRPRSPRSTARRTYVAAMCCGMVDECLRVASAYGSGAAHLWQALARAPGLALEPGRRRHRTRGGAAAGRCRGPPHRQRAAMPRPRRPGPRSLPRAWPAGTSQR